MNNEHWVTTLVNSMAAKIIAFALLGLLAVAVSVGLFTNKHVDILGIKFNDKGNDTVQKIVYVTLDTSLANKIEPSKAIPIKPTKDYKPKQNKGVSKNVTKNAGNNNHSVNGDNNTVGINGDMTVTNEIELDQVNKDEIIRRIKKIEIEKGITNKKIMVSITGNSNLKKFTFQLLKFLEENGYEILGGTLGMNFGSFTGIIIRPDKDVDNTTDVINIAIGTI